MATFPALTPSEAPIIPGAWPATAHKSLNGAESSIRHGSAEVGRTWRPSFVNITEANYQAILAHYRGQRSGFDSFGFTTTTLAADLTPAGFAWLYASSPQVIDEHADCFTVQCEFRCEPRGLVVAPGKAWRTGATTFTAGGGGSGGGGSLYTFTGGTTMSGASGILAYGWTFTVSATKTIKGVGVYDESQNGLAQVFNVNLAIVDNDLVFQTQVPFDEDGSIFNIQVPNGTQAGLSGAWRRVDLPGGVAGLQLTPGATYVLYMAPPGGATIQDSMIKGASSLTLPANVVYGVNVFVVYSGLGTVPADGTAYFGPMIFFE